MPLIALPVTFYFVAAVRLKPGQHMVCTEVFQVSGDNPLTRDEVVARFREKQSREWNESRWGKESDWDLQTNTITVRGNVLGGNPT